MKHIDVLREAGLIHTREEGRQRINSLNVVPIRQIYERWVGRFEELWTSHLVRIKEDAEAQRLKNLVTTYENMKAKDAARIFDRLEMRILVEVASLINPRRMSDILGQMSSEAAERLTVELANRAIASVDKTTDAGNLPKIEGVPKN